MLNLDPMKALAQLIITDWHTIMRQCRKHIDTFLHHLLNAEQQPICSKTETIFRFRADIIAHEQIGSKNWNKAQNTT